MATARKGAADKVAPLFVSVRKKSRRLTAAVGGGIHRFIVFLWVFV